MRTLQDATLLTVGYELPLPNAALPKRRHRGVELVRNAPRPADSARDRTRRCPSADALVRAATVNLTLATTPIVERMSAAFDRTEM